MKSQPRKVIVKVTPIPEYERSHRENTLNATLARIARELGAK